MIRIKIKENYIELELTPKELKEKDALEKEANLIHKEIIIGIKSILLVSLFIILGLLINSII